MKAFQLKIVIKNSKPPIWRRVVVPAGITFSQLSMILNKVMDWDGYHQFEFEFYHLEQRLIEDAEDINVGYGPYDYIEASTTYIRKYLEENQWFTYTYDLGDGWEHRVTVEAVLEEYEYNYPRVLKYKGDCPVEDSGGIYGYYDKLQILENPLHPRFGEVSDWMLLQGYPQYYDMEEINAGLEAEMFYIWGEGEKRWQQDIYEDHMKGRLGLHATKEDENQEITVNRSGRHLLEDAMEQFSKTYKEYADWRQQIPMTTLGDILEDYEKAGIYEIAKEKGVKGISGLPKKKLIGKLVAHMLQPQVLMSYFLYLSDEKLAEFERTAKSNSVSQPQNTWFLMDLYAGGYIGQLGNEGFVVPRDVYQLYQSLADEHFHERRRQLSFLLACIRFSTEMYGMVPFSVFMELVKQYPGPCMTEEEVRTEIERIPTEYAEVGLMDDMICDMLEWENRKELLEVQGDIDYYIPTRQEIHVFGEHGYLKGNIQLEAFRRFAEKKCNLDKEIAEDVCRLLQRSITAGCTPEEAAEILETFGMDPGSYKTANRLSDALIQVVQNTRMIAYRGHTIMEMLLMQKQSQRGQHAEPHGQGTVINIQETRKDKVYPNDPCPCGSGKKYKNCCRNKK